MRLRNCNLLDNINNVSIDCNIILDVHIILNIVCKNDLLNSREVALQEDDVCNSES